MKAPSSGGMLRPPGWQDCYLLPPSFRLAIKV
jgi:hypothetical protein